MGTNYIFYHIDTENERGVRRFKRIIEWSSASNMFAFNFGVIIHKTIRVSGWTFYWFLWINSGVGSKIINLPNPIITPPITCSAICQAQSAKI